MDTTTPPSAQTADAHETGTVRSTDGTEIGWRRSGSGDPAILLHGTSADSASWAMAGPHLGRPDSIAVLHSAIPSSEIAMLEGQANLGHALAPEVFSSVVLEFIDRVE